MSSFYFTFHFDHIENLFAFDWPPLYLNHNIWLSFYLSSSSSNSSWYDGERACNSNDRLELITPVLSPSPLSGVMTRPESRRGIRRGRNEYASAKSPNTANKGPSHVNITAFLSLLPSVAAEVDGVESLGQTGHVGHPSQGAHWSEADCLGNRCSLLSKDRPVWVRTCIISKATSGRSSGTYGEVLKMNEWKSEGGISSQSNAMSPPFHLNDRKVYPIPLFFF